MKRKILKTMLLGALTVLTLLTALGLCSCSSWRRLPSSDAPKEVPTSASQQQ